MVWYQKHISTTTTISPLSQKSRNIIVEKDTITSDLVMKCKLCLTKEQQDLIKLHNNMVIKTKEIIGNSLLLAQLYFKAMIIATSLTDFNNNLPNHCQLDGNMQYIITITIYEYLSLYPNSINILEKDYMLNHDLYI